MNSPKAFIAWNIMNYDKWSNMQFKVRPNYDNTSNKKEVEEWINDLVIERVQISRKLGPQMHADTSFFTTYTVLKHI